MNSIFCCFGSCKLKRSLNELVDECNNIEDPRERGNIIQATLQNQWQRIFTQNVGNKQSNRQFLAQKIEHLLIGLPQGIPVKDFLVRYIKSVQTFLNIIQKESLTVQFRQHFALPQNARIEEINLAFQEEGNELAFVLRFTGGQSVVCFSPDYNQASTILNYLSIPMIHLPLGEEGFRAQESGNQYYRAVSGNQVRIRAKEEAEEVDFQLLNIAFDRKHLTEKIKLILDDHRQPLAQKRQIIEQVKLDAINYIHEAVAHIQQDLANDEDFRSAFHLNENEQIEKIEVLGQETHNSGKTPLLITFVGGNRIVYKPRSLKTESVICSIQKYSLFAHARLPTYAIISKGSYGYAQYLENLQNENTFETVQQVEQYLQIFIQMDSIIRQLRGSDLHSENVVTQNKHPYLIDTEVVLGPIPGESLLATKDFQAAWVFHENTYNRIWFTKELADELALQNNEPLEDSDFYELFLERFSHLKPQLPEIPQQIRMARNLLSSFRHRIVAVNTGALSQFIRMPLERGTRQFLRQLENDLPQHNLEFIEESIPFIQEQFSLDVQHNDVPIFYYDPHREECFYKNILIGRKIPPNIIKID